MKILIFTLLLILSFFISIVAGIGEGQSASGVLPVELTSFSAKVSKKNVQLIWQTATEVNNYGFEIERTANLQGLETHSGDSNLVEYSDNVSWRKIGFVNGHGNSNSQIEYKYADETAPSGNLQYRLKQIDTDGSFKYSHIVEVTILLPVKIELEQNFPNPFNPTTTISYQLTRKSRISLIIYDALGRQVKSLVNKEQNPGYYNVHFNASSLSSGIYFYRISAGKFVSVKKMILLK